MPKPNAASRAALRARHEKYRADKREAGWMFHDDGYTIEGRLPLVKGRLFRVSGMRGWFMYEAARTTPDGKVEIDCYSGYDKDGMKNGGVHMSRCFYAERVKRVSRDVVPTIRKRIGG